MAHFVEGKRLNEKRAWTHPKTGVQYPRNWLRLATADEKAKAGVTWEDDPTPPPAPEPTLDDLKFLKVFDGERKTQEIYARGVPAEHRGVTYRFDTRTGSRAASNWLILDSIILRALMSPEMEAMLFPRNISTIDDQQLELATASEANLFYVGLMTSDNAIATEGAILRKQWNAATTKEALDAIVDERE